jgi:hypothetical protein
MTDFLKGPNNTFRLNHRYPSFGRPWTRVYADTLLDSWFVGDFASANYYITVEYDSNQKETMQVSVIARPEHASFTIYGRTSIQYELITLLATVNASKLNLTASALPGFDGAKVIFTATYGETINQLGKPTVVIGSGLTDGEVTPIETTRTFGNILILSNPDVTAETASDSVTFLAGDGIGITSNNVSKSITFSSITNNFKNFTIGTTVLTADNPNDSIRLVPSNSVGITASSLTNEIAISATGILDNLNVSGESVLNTLSVSGNTTVSNLTVSGNFVVTGTTTTTNSAAVSIADYVITLAQGAATSQIANGAGVTIAGALASMKWDHTTLSWQFNKILTPSVNNTYTLGTPNLLWQNVYATTLTGTLATGPQPNITALGSLDTLTINGVFNATLSTVAQPNITSVGTLSGLSVGGLSTTSSLTVTGLTTLQQTQELYLAVTPAATAAFNFVNGGIYYCTGMNQNFTAVYTNVPTYSPYTVATTVILVQGGTPYVPTTLSINGVSQIIKWLGGSVPTGSASKVNIVGFTFIITSNNVYTVLGSYAEYY